VLAHTAGTRMMGLTSLLVFTAALFVAAASPASICTL
jgi:hypothetical protein